MGGSCLVVDFVVCSLWFLVVLRVWDLVVLLLVLVILGCGLDVGFSDVDVWVC